MPYSGADDPSLPANVRRLAPSKRRQWVHIFNATLTRTGSEGSAFRQANGRVKEFGIVLPDDPDLALDYKDLIDIFSDADFWADLKRRILRRLTPKMRAIFDEGMAVARSLDVPGYVTPVRTSVGQRDFLDPDPAALDDIAGLVFRNYQDDWWLQIETTTREQLRAAIMRSAQEGTGVRQVIRDIEPLFGRERAKRIGVTETTRLFGRGAQATYRASGLEKWVWRTVEDDRVCPTCDALSGSEYSMDIGFDPAHVTCRCWPSPVEVGQRDYSQPKRRLLSSYLSGFINFRR